jgi:hypothetical protein
LGACFDYDQIFLRSFQITSDGAGYQKTVNITQYHQAMRVGTGDIYMAGTTNPTRVTISNIVARHSGTSSQAMKTSIWKSSSRFPIRQNNKTTNSQKNTPACLISSRRNSARAFAPTVPLTGKFSLN